MAVIKANTGKPSSTLQALTTAALVLPGLTINPAHAGEDDQFSFQYSRYQEGHRKTRGAVLFRRFTPAPFAVDSDGTYDNPDYFKPIEVDSIAASGNISLTEHLQLNFNYTQDTWSGATPISTSPVAAEMTTRILKNDTLVGASAILRTGRAFVDGQGNPLIVDFDSNFRQVAKTNKELTHVLVSASPETRQQMDMQLRYEWDQASLTAGGGVSLERDYDAYFINLGGSWDFNQKRTTLSLNGSYTNSSINAIQDPDAVGFTSRLGHEELVETVHDTGNSTKDGFRIIHAQRDDWSINLGLNHILYKDGIIKTGIGYTHSTGFLENPYKYTLFLNLDPTDAAVAPGIFRADTIAFLEQRPNLRRQFTWDLGYIQYIKPLDAALHLDYQLHLDDWGIDAHTFEAEWIQPLAFGWTIAPRVRYYSQSAADFYTPYLLTHAANITSNTTIDTPNERKILAAGPQYFSSDHRLSGFGTLSAGVTLSKEFAKGIKLEAGYEYYTHQGSLKMGGGGEGEYADFDYYAFNAALTVNLSALSGNASVDTNEHSSPAHHAAHAPAGVRFAHMLSKADQFMVGYRYQHSRRKGAMRNGSRRVSDQEIRKQGCRGEINGCLVRPSEMDMTMHMLNIMYAPTDWLNLMLMPQFVTKSMNMHPLEGIGSISNGPDNNVTSITDAFNHTAHQHESGALGDIGMYVLVKLLDLPQHRLHLSFGATAPTGDIDLELRRVHRSDFGFTHYGMQVGSGTWDLKPGITYSGNTDNWFWGGQVTGTYRLDKNDSGFAFGNNLQATAWGGYKIFNWLSATVRGVYSIEGELKGEYPEDAHVPVGPMDHPENYGGEYWDLGLGLQASVTSGDLVGNSVSVEWLQPLVDDVNGYQLERESSLVINWNYSF